MDNVDTIAGARFCTWRGEPVPDHRLRISIAFIVVLAATFLGTGWGARCFLHEIEIDYLAADNHTRAFAIALLCAICGGWLCLAVWRHAVRRPARFRLDPEPEVVAPVTVVLQRKGSSFCRASGWVWAEGANLMFRSEEFDMSLHLSEVQKPRRAFWGSHIIPHKLNVPKAVGSYAIMFAPSRSGFFAAHSRAARRALAAVFQQWNAGGKRCGESLFPPLLKPISRSALREGVLHALGAVAVIFLGTAFVFAQIPAAILQHFEGNHPALCCALLASGIAVSPLAGAIGEVWQARKLIALGLRPEQVWVP